MKRLIYTVSFLLLSICGAGAQQVMTLEQCREMALENNKQMAVSAQMREKAGLDVKAYRANYFPKLSLTGNYLFSNTESKLTLPGGYLPTFVPGPDGTLVPNLLPGTAGGEQVFNQYAYMPDTEFRLKLNNTYTAGIKAEQPLFMGGKITTAYRMAKIGQELAELSGKLTRSEVLVLTDEAYWMYVKASELHKVAKQYQEVVGELLRNVQDGYEVGMIQRNNVLKVQVKQNEAELQLRKAENAIRLARMNLCHRIGLPLTTDIALPDSFEMPTVSKAQQVDITTRPEYAILDKQVEMNRQKTRLVRSEFLPNVGVAAMYNYTHGVTLNEKPLFDNTSFAAVISVNIPLFQWGEGRNKIRAAKTEQKIAELQQMDAGEKMELELMQAINQVDEAVLEVSLTQNSLVEAEENLKMHKDLYETGMATLVDYLEAQTAWQKAGADCVNANAALRLSITKYQKAAGEL